MTSSYAACIPELHECVKYRGREFIGKYELLKVLGTGSFGKVKLGRHCVTGLQVAIKIMSKKKLADNEA